MLSVIIFCILKVIWLTSGVSATDYCSSSLCSSGSTHIACNNNGTFSSACPKNQTEMVIMTQDLIDKILHNHNSKRELIASGGLSGFEPATKMSYTRWNYELAELAALNVKTCNFGHDTCHNTNKFKKSGQNLAKIWYKKGSATDEQLVLTRIDSWWIEYKNTSMSQIQSFPKYPEKMIGHFTVMTAENSTFMGCSAIKFPSDNFLSLTLACNYATTNIIGRALYKSGPTASECTSGTSPDYPSLCI